MKELATPHFSMYSEFSGEVGGGKRPGSPVSLKGEVLAHTEKGIQVRVGRQVLQVPLSQSLPPPVGARVLLQISPSGDVQVIPAKGESVQLGRTAPLPRDLLLALSGGSEMRPGRTAYGSASARQSQWGVVRGVESLPDPKGFTSTDGRGRVFLLALDVGDSQIRGQYSGKVQVGEVLHFHLQPSEQPGIFHIAPLKSGSSGIDPSRMLPPEALTPSLRALLQSPAAGHPAATVAYEALLPFKGEPFFAQSVADFAAFLRSSPAFSGDRLVVPPQWEGTAQQWVQHLLGMYAANSGSSPEALNAWILWQNQPHEMEKMLAQWKPAGEFSQKTVLLHADLPLVRQEGTASRESLTLRELWQHPQRMDSLSTSSEDKQLFRQLVQAFQMESSTGGGQKDSGGENFGQSYAWQEGRWRKIKVRWRSSREKNKKKGEQNFSISTEGKHLGRVEVDLNLRAAGAGLNIRTQHQDIREHLPEAIRSLEKKLSHLDFKVMSWNWEPWREKKSRKPGAGIPRDPSPGDVDVIV